MSSEEYPVREIRFIGLLANVDSSILKLNFQNNFKIESMEYKEAIDFFSHLFGLPDFEMLSILDKYSCLSESNKIYFVSNNFYHRYQSKDKSHSTIPQFEHSLIDGYLMPLIRLMRLFKDGNVMIPYNIYYFMDGQVPKLMVDWGKVLPSKKHVFTLNDDEIRNLKDFIQTTKLPFSKPFLQLAFENFELSFETFHQPNIEFLLLMISLEVLFNPSDRQELSYRISRSVAVLLGQNESDSQKIYSTVRDLYGKRSNLVHNGISVITDTDITNLRHFVRESIKIIDKSEKDREKIMNVLNSSGFGSKPF
jgi:hypothetical protein